MKDSPLKKRNIRLYPFSIRGISSTFQKQSDTRYTFNPSLHHPPQDQYTQTSKSLFVEEIQKQIFQQNNQNQQESKIILPHIQNHNLEKEEFNRQQIHQQKQDQYKRQQDNQKVKFTQVGIIKNQSLLLQAKKQQRYQKMHNQFTMSLLIRRDKGCVNKQKERPLVFQQKERPLMFQQKGRPLVFQQKRRLSSYEPHKNLKMQRYQLSQLPFQKNKKNIIKSLEKKNFNDLYHSSFYEPKHFSKSKFGIQSLYPFNPQLLRQNSEHISRLKMSQMNKNKTPTESSLPNNSNLFHKSKSIFDFPELVNQKSKYYQITWNTSEVLLYSLYDKLFDNTRIKIVIPELFLNLQISPDVCSHSLNQISKEIEQQLGLQSFICFRKYTNCVILIGQKTTVIYNFSGKIYIGGWKLNKKQGKGIQWKPNQYIYFGQFKDNQKNGLGIRRESNGNVYFGWWKHNQILK